MTKKALQPLSPTFLLLATTFCICLITSNLMEIKTVPLLEFMTITAGVIVFPISYIINDCIVEVYGFRRARMVIWLGFGMNLLVTLLLQFGLWLPGTADWEGQQAMQTVFGAVPRILFASFTAFVIGSMVNAWVMHRMHLRHRNRLFALRAIVSTVLGEGADSLVFFPIAFLGVLPGEMILNMIVTQTLLKTLYEVAVLPVTMRCVRFLLRREERFMAALDRPSRGDF